MTATAEKKYTYHTFDKAPGTSDRYLRPGYTGNARLERSSLPRMYYFGCGRTIDNWSFWPASMCQGEVFISDLDPNFLFCFNLVRDTSRSNHYGGYRQEHTRWVANISWSRDGGTTWTPEESAMDYISNSRKKFAYNKINDMVEAKYATWKKARARQQARDRKEAYQEKAEELGLTMKEYMGKRRLEREEKKELKEMEFSLKDTQKRMQLASTMVEMKDEVDEVLMRIKENKDLNLRWYSNKMEKVRVAISHIRDLTSTTKRR